MKTHYLRGISINKINIIMGILIAFLFSCSDNSSSKNNETDTGPSSEKVFFKHREKYEYRIEFRSDERGFLDSEYIYNKSNDLCFKLHYKDGHIIKNFKYEDNKLKYIKDKELNKVFYYQPNGSLSSINNYNDSSTIIYFGDGKSIRHFIKENKGVQYYRNTYDSASQKLITCHRLIREKITISKDSIFLEPSFFDKGFRDISVYRFLIILQDDNGFVIHTYSQQSKHPKFALKNTHKKIRYLKVICDSLGCSSLPTTIQDLD